MNKQDPMHQWFSLSYASYLTLPRTIIQSCSDEAQQKLVEALEDMNAECRTHGVDWPQDGKSVRVQLVDDATGKFEKDPMANYERGRRRLW